MTDQFSFTRFRRLFIKHTAEHLKNYAMSLSVLLGVLVLGGGFLLFVLDARIDSEVLHVLYLIVGVLAGTIFTSTIFSELGDKRKSIPWLTLPATHFEKFLVAWMYSYFIFMVLYSALFYLIGHLALRLESGMRKESFSLFDSRFFLVPLVVFSFLHALAFFGAVRFNNLHFIRTGFFFVTVFLAVIVLNHALMQSLVGRPLDLSPPFTLMRFQYEGREVKVESLKERYPMLPIMAGTILLWVATYFCIKEKEA